MAERAAQAGARAAPADYLVADEEDPLGLLLEDAEPPLVPPVLLDDVPLSVEDDVAPPLPELLVPPVALLLLESGALGVVLEDDEDEPPGTTTVSFSFVTDEVGAGLLPGTTVVVVSFSQPARASAPASTNR